MAVVDYYVDTASSSGGDGTTSATTGIHRAFANLNAALAALHTAYPNFVTSAVNPVIHCAASGGAADTTNISFPSFTSSSTYYLTIQNDSALSGIYDTSKYRVENNSITTFTNYPAYTRFVRLQVVNGADDNTLSVWGTGSMGAQGVVVDSCIARFKVMARSFGNTSTIFHGGTDQTGDPSIVRNCLFYDVFTNTNKGVCAITSVNGNVLVDSCTLIGPGSAADSTCAPVIDGYTRIKVRNTLVYNWAASGTHGTSDYNASDRSTAFGGVHDRVSQAFTFVNAAAAPPQYQLASGDAGAKGFGEVLSSDSADPYSVDITGTTRTTPWDIGAFIAAAASGVAATGTAGQVEGASGSAGESIVATGSAGSAAGAVGTAGEKIAATGSAGEQEGATGNVGEQIAATGSAGEQESASGAAGAAIGATGSAGEVEAAAGNAGESVVASGSAGQEESAAGNAGESIAASGSAGQEEGAQGAAGTSGDASITGSGAQEEGAQGSAGESVPATGAAGQQESAQGVAGERIAASGSGASAGGASGNASEQIAASGSGAQQESAAGNAGESISATGSAGEVESAGGAAGQTQPGAPHAIRVTRLIAAPVVTVARVRAIAAVTVTRVAAFPTI